MRSFTFSPTSSPLALKWLISITRVDGTVVRFTDAQRDITISANTWVSADGCTVTNAEYYSDGTVSNVQIALALHSGSVITAQDIAIGKYRNATLSMQIVNILSPSIGAAHFTGYVGATTMNARGNATIEGRGQLILGTTIVVETYQAMDLAELGDFRSHIQVLPPDIQRNTLYPSAATDARNLNQEFVRVRIAAAGNPSDYANLYWEITTAGTTAGSQPGGYAGAIAGSVVTDGSAVLTARNAWLRWAQVGTITDDFHFSVANLIEPRAAVYDVPGVSQGWYTQGQALIRSGNGSGFSVEIRGWGSGNIIFAALPITGLIASGDWLELIPGYDKTAQTAFGKFNNIVNFRGDPFAPAAGALLSPSGAALTPGVPGATGGTGAGSGTVPREFGISSPVFQVPAGTPFTF